METRLITWNRCLKLAAISTNYPPKAYKVKEVITVIIIIIFQPQTRARWIKFPQERIVSGS